MKKSVLKKIYRYDDEKNAFLIDISLNNYQELFNDWDASPIRKKDLDPDFLDYLETSALEITKKENMIINFSLPKIIKKKESEEKVMQSIKNNFITTIHFIRKDLTQSFRKILLFILVGFTLVIFAYMIKFNTSINLAFDVITEGLFIGGWVLLWEAFSLFFFSSYELRKKKKMYQRFLLTEIMFTYK